MFFINKKMSSIVLTLCVLVGSSFSAQALLIKQDILASLFTGESGLLGSVTVEIADSLIGTDQLLDTAFEDPGFRLVDLTILGESQFEIFDFNAAIFSSGILVGLESLQFDLFDLSPRGWSFSGSFDLFGDPANNVFDIFAGSEIVTFGTIRLGDVQFVSIPSIGGLILLAGAFIVMRRETFGA